MSVELFPEFADDAPCAFAPVIAPERYRCSSSADCAEQIAVLRFVELGGRNGRTPDEIAVAMTIRAVRLGQVLDWMVDKDGFVRWDFAVRDGIKTAVVVAAHLPAQIPKVGNP